MERDKDRFLWPGIAIGTVVGFAIGHLAVGVALCMGAGLVLGRMKRTAR
jgi:hypothetical protein